MHRAKMTNLVPDKRCVIELEIQMIFLNLAKMTNLVADQRCRSNLHITEKGTKMNSLVQLD